MAITVRRDLINGHDYQEDDKTGELRRAYRVDGLTSSSSITDQALTAVDSTNAAIKVPRAGEKHETMPDLVVRRVDVVPVNGSKNAVRVIVTYMKIRRRLLNVTIGGVSQQTTTNRDINGQIMTVGYASPFDGVTFEPTKADTPFPPVETESKKKNSLYEYNYVEVPFLLPDVSLEIVYLELGSPFPKCQKYIRTLNDGLWQGGERRTWLCESITAQIDSPIPENQQEMKDPKVVTGKALFFWQVTYRFRYSPLPFTNGKLGPTAGWDPLVRFIDRQVGRIPIDVDPVGGGWPNPTGANKPAANDTSGIIRGNGWAQFQLYGESHFDDLNLVSAIEQAPVVP